MIFVDSVEKNMALEKHLQSFMPNNLKDKGKKIFVSFSSILEIKTKTDCLEDFLNSNTKILICTDVAGMRVDIPDIKRVI